jgi:CBS-domain-containing membrane protein
MKVRDVMTRRVTSVPADTPVMAVARLLADRGISAVPVTDSWGMLLGIVSEADLIRRLSTSDAPEPGFFRALFYDREQAAARYAAVHGATAGDIMTRDVVTVTEEVTVEHAAHLLETHNVRRLPVVQDGVLVGILSRADLLRALLAPAQDTSDASIRSAVAAEIARLPWADAPYVFFDVANGTVTLYGFCHSVAVRRGLVAIAAGVPGVQKVEDRITDVTPGRMV